MPIYEYHCTACDARVEVLLLSHGSEPRCPDCGAVLTARLISAPFVAVRSDQRAAGRTCCGRTERCGVPPCTTEDGCRR